MKKRVFIVIILIAIFGVWLSNCFTAEQNVTEDALLKEASKGKIIKLGEDLVDIKKVDRKGEILISETEITIGNKPRSKYGYNVITTRKQAVLSPDMQFIAKVTNIYGHEDSGKGLLEYYDQNGRKLFEKRYEDTGITCKVMKDGEYIIVHSGGGLFGDKEDTLEVFNKVGDLVLCEQGIDDDDFSVSPEGKLLFIKKKKDGKTILEKRDLFENKIWTREFDSKDVEVTTSQDGNYFICENEDRKIVYSFKSDGKLLWKKSFSHLKLYPGIWLSEKGKYFLFAPYRYNSIELYDNLNGILIFKKEIIKIGNYTFLDYNPEIISEKYIVIEWQTFTADNKHVEITIGILDIKGTPLWADKVLLKREIDYYYKVNFSDNENLITISKFKFHEHQEIEKEIIRKIKVNFKQDGGKR